MYKSWHSKMDPQSSIYTVHVHFLQNFNEMDTIYSTNTNPPSTVSHCHILTKVALTMQALVFPFQASLWIYPTMVLPSNVLWYSYLLLQPEVLLLIVTIEYCNSICNKYNFVCQAKLSPRLSPWQYLFDHADSSLFLLMTEVSHSAFRMLLSILYTPSELM